MASDGKVVISTALDNSGIEKGVKEIKGSLGGLNSVIKTLGTTIAAAFSIRQIVSFMKDSSAAARGLSDALKGLRSILDGQDRSFSKAQSFIEDYTSDGLIPATNAIAAYKNLASRGYDDTQIRQVMTALKDASAYGRQASYTMGEAVQSATEGLKNENSILVDNAGVTKNVAKMWEEYAASIGTTASNLTQAQKIQAEVNGILEETKYQMGDAATVAGTLSGQLQQLSYNFNNLKVAVGEAINPIVESFLPIINTAITAVTKLANALATVIGLAFGKVSASEGNLVESNDSIASSASAGADAEKELADATTAAGKAAKKSLASFDELNKLQGDFGGGSSSTSTGGAPSGGIEIEATTEVEDTVSPKLQAIAEKIKELLAPLQQIDFGPATDAFARLGDAAKKLGKTIGEALEWVWFNILVPLASWSAEEALPAFLELLSATLELLNSAIIALRPAAEWLWDNLLQPLARWTGGVIVDVLTEMTDLFHKLSNVISGNMSFGELLGQLTHVQTELLAIAAALGAIKIASTGITIFNTITKFIESVKAMNATGLFGKLAELVAVLSGAAGPMTSLSDALQMVFGTTATIIGGIASAVGGAVLAVTNFLSMLERGFDWVNEALMLLGVAITAVGAIILGAPAAVAGVIAAIVAAVATAVVAIKGNWATISSWFDENVIQPVSKFFYGLWENISTWASEAWENIKEFFAPAIEWFGDLLNRVCQTFDEDFYNIGMIASGCWDYIVQVWSGVSGWFDENILTPLSTGFKGMVNGVIGFINGMISAVQSGINAVIEAINEISFDVPDWVPGIGGTTFGFNLQTVSFPQIPYLAKGAVLPANKPFLAMVGDQKHGTNIEAPLETIQEAVAIVMEDMIGSQVAGFEAVVSVLKEILEAILGIEIDGEVLTRAVENYQRKMSVVKGG